MLHTMAHSETRLACFVRCKTDFGTDPINSDKLRFREHATRSVSRAGAKIAEAEGRSRDRHSAAIQELRP